MGLHTNIELNEYMDTGKYMHESWVGQIEYCYCLRYFNYKFLWKRNQCEYRVSKGLNGLVSDFRKWAYIYDVAETEGNAAAQKVAGLLFSSSSRNLLINKGFNPLS